MGSVVGGILGGNKAAKAAKKASKRFAKAGVAAEAASQFKPVGTTNAFGTTQYTYNPQGQLETAGYQLNPQLSALSQGALGAAGTTGQQFYNQATQAGLGLTGLGAQYIAQSPEEAAAKYMQQQQALLQPGQDYARAQMNQGLFSSGRGGLTVEGPTGAANPEMVAYYNSLVRQQAELAANADLYGRQRVAFGADLTGQGLRLGSSAYAPQTANLNMMKGVEGLGQDVLNQGLQMGGLRTTAAQVGAGRNLEAQGQSIQARQTADAYSPWAALASGIGSVVDPMLGNWASSFGSAPPVGGGMVGGGGMSPTYTGSGSNWQSPSYSIWGK